MLPNAIPKPVRGDYILEREKKRAGYEKELADAKKSAKLRDGFTCRWPEVHKCRGLLESAHYVDASLGGRPVRSNLICVCAWIHRRGPQSIHGKTLKVEPETPHGMDGPCAFWKRATVHDEWICVGVEIQIGVLRKT